MDADWPALDGKQSAARAFLALAVSPQVQAASRWISVNATTKTTYALAGKDGPNALLDWLAAGRPNTGPQTEKLKSAATRLGIDDRMDGHRYVDWYRQLNEGYPFLDYSSDDGRKSDSRLMDAYADVAPAPPPATAFDGDVHPLPRGIVHCTSRPAQARAELLAGWLRIAAGVTGYRELATARVSLKTSPSGGARHPTEIAVQAGSKWGSALSGSWWYDPHSHALTGPASFPGVRCEPDTGDEVVFTIASHVERAMWRYRDVRAFRPLLIDAGHVVETLLAVIRASGWTAVWHPCPDFVEVRGQLDPTFGQIIAAPDMQLRRLTTQQFGCLSGGLANDVYRTNPLISLTSGPNSLAAENHLSGGHPTPLTPTMVEALAYATPSSRRDRPTDRGSLTSATGLDQAGLDALVSSGLLLDEETGDRIWRMTQHWSSHGWYLSLLAHAESVAQPRSSTSVAPQQVAPPHLGAALDNRRTCREFSGAPLADSVMCRLLRTAVDIPPSLQAIACVWHDSSALLAGVYTAQAQTWVPSPMSLPTEVEISRAAIGQPWAHGFAVVVWFVPAAGPAGADWEQALIDCGRAAQRLTLSVVDDPGVGVFQSPALIDDVLTSILGDAASIDGAYLVGIGVAADAKVKRPMRFRPSALLSGSAPSKRLGPLFRLWEQHQSDWWAVDLLNGTAYAVPTEAATILWQRHDLFPDAPLSEALRIAPSYGDAPFLDMRFVDTTVRYRGSQAVISRLQDLYGGASPILRSSAEVIVTLTDEADIDRLHRSLPERVGVTVQSNHDVDPFPGSAVLPILPPMQAIPLARRFTGLHAALLAAEYGAVAICGHQKMGKTTAVVRASAAGQGRILSDELVMLDQLGNAWGVALPVRERTSVGRGAYSLQPQLRGAEMVPVVHVVILERGDCGRFELTDTTEKLRALTPHIRPLDNALGFATTALLGLAGRARVWRWTTRDWPQLADDLDAGFAYLQELAQG